VPHPISTS
jgi:hypothetical protein